MSAIDISSTNESKIFMQDTFEQQKQAFLSLTFQPKKERIHMLKALKRALITNKIRLLKSLSTDFGHRSDDESLLADLLPSIMSINYTVRHLRKWMKPEKRHTGLLFQPAKTWIEYQPLGVVGIVVPWNYPIYLTIGPLVSALAAGNRVMIKLSEFTPYTNRILRELIESVFDQTEVAIVEGNAQVASAFTSLPFDHLLFTGSTEVGKHVMRAASNNLTPVTLELGGKSPVIIADDVPLEDTIDRIIFGKTLNAGQTCIAPDYVLCPKDKVGKLAELIENQFQIMFPNIAANPDYTAIINAQQFGRLSAWISEAESAGCNIIKINPDNENFDPQKRKIPLTLIIDPPSNINLSQNEIFGPILPIFSYQTIQDAIQFIQERPRPLALYLMSYDKKIQKKVLLETHAGGICINDTLNHVAQDDIPFGGVGASGMGHYHAKEGFLTFSKAKAVFKKGKLNSAKMAYPPYGKWIHKFIYWLYLR